MPYTDCDYHSRIRLHQVMREKAPQSLTIYKFFGLIFVSSCEPFEIGGEYKTHEIMVHGSNGCYEFIRIDLCISVASVQSVYY